MIGVVLIARDENRSVDAALNVGNELESLTDTPNWEEVAIIGSIFRLLNQINSIR